MRRRSGPATGFAFLDHEGPIPFAHRGGAAGGVENSMAAFQQAVDLGYRYVETDVHATADGVLLAFHDRTLERVTGLSGRVARMPYDDVRHARIGGREPIPRLEEVLRTWPELRVNIDVKDSRAVAPLVEVITRTGALPRVCVASFSGPRVAAVRQALGPELCTAQSPRQVAQLRAASLVRFTGALASRAVPCVQVPDRVGRLRVVTPELIALAHRHGLRVHVWTIDDAAEMRRLLDLGVDGIMTDQLLTLRQVLDERGRWSAPPAV
jgi:glycerophosphoryl diester phosphodiesterase